MQLEMSSNEVIQQIQHLGEKGEPLTKRKVKETNPTLLQHALYYYPSWEHALKESGITQTH